MICLPSKIYETDISRDQLLLGSKFDTATMTPRHIGEQFCLARDSSASSFLHITDLAALLVFVVDEDQEAMRILHAQSLLG
jgi:hypothetical protein